MHGYAARQGEAGSALGRRRSALENLEGLSFFKGKRVFLTGHTGFKGAWMCAALLGAGAELRGYALDPPTEPSLFELLGLRERMDSVYGDIRDLPALERAFLDFEPEIAVHLAAQPLVQEGYLHPVETFHTNTLGTVHLLDCARRAKRLRSLLIVTTDKVYRNREWDWGYRETDDVDGHDPYANSKACAELATRCYRECYLADIGVSTARAGNVIGGGDFAKDRIIPDCVRAALAGRAIAVRNPASVRPYQHVLEAVFAYLAIIEAQYIDASFSGSYNVGPEDADCVTTEALVRSFCACWGKCLGWQTVPEERAREATLLRLDASRLKRALGWRPRWDYETAIAKTVEWTKAYREGGELLRCVQGQIDAYARKERGA